MKFNSLNESFENRYGLVEDLGSDELDNIQQDYIEREFAKKKGSWLNFNPDIFPGLDPIDYEFGDNELYVIYGYNGISVLGIIYTFNNNSIFAAQPAEDPRIPEYLHDFWTSIGAPEDDRFAMPISNLQPIIANAVDQLDDVLNNNITESRETCEASAAKEAFRAELYEKMLGAQKPNESREYRGVF